MPSRNRVIVASAGSGKTTTLVDTACADSTARSAMITYTQNGRDEIVAVSYQRFGCVPPHVKISTWFTFLLRHFVRPYQRCLYEKRVGGIHFLSNRSPFHFPESNTRRHYFSRADLMYSDKVSKFACKVIEATDGLPLKRFERIFDRLLIDESQDLAGYDLDLMDMLLQSKVAIFLVGDHRQATYATHSAHKNKKYGGANIVLKYREWEKGGLCTLEYQNHSQRCVQAICDFADQFFADAPRTKSFNTEVTGHDGVFAVRRSDVASYVAKYQPQPLRYDKRTTVPFGRPINYAASKGMTFPRTLIYCHGPLKKFLKTGNLEDSGKEPEKLYVAVTRARHSAAFVVDDNAVPQRIPIFRP